MVQSQSCKCTVQNYEEGEKPKSLEFESPFEQLEKSQSRVLILEIRQQRKPNTKFFTGQTQKNWLLSSDPTIKNGENRKSKATYVFMYFVSECYYLQEEQPPRVKAKE